MDDQTASIIKVMIVSSTIMIGFIASAWGSRRKSAPPPAQSTPQLTELSLRLERIEQTVDSIAIEMERASEAQRFTAKLLAERTVEAPKPPARVITPH